MLNAEIHKKLIFVKQLHKYLQFFNIIHFKERKSNEKGIKFFFRAYIVTVHKSYHFVKKSFQIRVRIVIGTFLNEVILQVKGKNILSWRGV